MTSHDDLLVQGIAAAKAGDKSTARRLLSGAVQLDPGSEPAWLWLSSVLDTPQGRAYCLRQVLALNPANRAAQKGLAALEAMARAPAVVAQAPVASALEVAPALQPQPADLAASPPEVAPVRQPPADMTAGGPVAVPVRQPEADVAARPPAAWRRLVRRPQFWRVVVACLAVVALGLIGVLAYATFSGSRAAEKDTLAAMVPLPSPLPHGTLRPTFTATPTPTLTFTPSLTPTPSPTPTSTPTPTATPTETPSPTSTRRVRRPSPTATPLPAPVPRATLPARVLDPRLPDLGVRVEPAFVAEGKPYWRLVEARWTNEQESAGKHTIYVEVLDARGNRAVGQPVIVQWVSGSVVLSVQDVPPPDWGANFAMYNTLGSYAVSVGGAPSDRIVGLGMGTAEMPDFTVHTSFYLTFRLTYR